MITAKKENFFIVPRLPPFKIWTFHNRNKFFLWYGWHQTTSWTFHDVNCKSGIKKFLVMKHSWSNKENEKWRIFRSWRLPEEKNKYEINQSDKLRWFCVERKFPLVMIRFAISAYFQIRYSRFYFLLVTNDRVFIKFPFEEWFVY